MCKVYKKKNTGAFRWDIDQHCTLVPADIVPCNSQFEPSPDPALEKIAEEATEKYTNNYKLIVLFTYLLDLASYTTDCLTV